MKHLLLDTETSDLVQNTGRKLDKQPHIIEFYGNIIDDSGIIEDELHFLCNPGVKLNADVTRITGLTDKDLQDKPPFSAFVGALTSFFNQADIIVAHNLSYDLTVIGFEFKRLSMPLQLPPIKLCTVEETEYLSGYRLSLTALHERLFKRPFMGAHRAKNDVKALTVCYVELLRLGIV
jgi:DNA polymerase-3 subunit alpha